MTTLYNWSLFGYPISRETAAAILMVAGCIVPLVCPFRVRKRVAQPRHGQRAQ
jgi:hypothetical protein